MTEADISDHVSQSAATVVNEDETRYYRMDVIWAHMKTMKDPNDTFKFPRLAGYSGTPGSHTTTFKC